MGLDLMYFLYRIPMPRSIYLMLRTALGDCRSVLDIGCGKKSILLRLGIKGIKITGMDIWQPYLGGEANRYHEIINADVTKTPLVPESFDLVMMSDVLGHLSKEDGFDTIAKMERAARKRVVIMLSAGEVGHKSHDGNPYQTHRSHWWPGELREMDYRVKCTYRLWRKDYPRVLSTRFIKTMFAVKDIKGGIR